MEDQSEEKFSEDPMEHFKIENEILKMKLKAQYGDAFQMFTPEGQLPPDVENQFLKNMINFEENYQNMEFIKILDKIGNPVIMPISAISVSELPAAIAHIVQLLNDKNIHIDFLEGPYDDELKYKFITEELLHKEIEKDMPEGMSCNFIYEEFHPNHKADVTKIGHEFIVAWITGNLAGVEAHLAKNLINDKGTQIKQEKIVTRIKNVFDAFEHFENDGYNVFDVGFKMNEDTDTGMGHVEGNLKFDAIVSDGEKVHFEGGCKIYLSYEFGFWHIFYFVMPGFIWE
jgi:hypothetical protein